MCPKGCLSRVCVWLTNMRKHCVNNFLPLVLLLWRLVNSSVHLVHSTEIHSYWRHCCTSRGQKGVALRNRWIRNMKNSENVRQKRWCFMLAFDKTVVERVCCGTRNGVRLKDFGYSFLVFVLPLLPIITRWMIVRKWGWFSLLLKFASWYSRICSTVLDIVDKHHLYP